MTLKAKIKGNAIKRAMLVAAAGLIPTAVLADEVALKSSDGTVNLVGEFVDFVDDNYVIRTALGDLRISAARVRCEGAACPTFDTAEADVVFAGSDTVGLGMMPLLISGYASYKDAEASVKATENEGEILANLVGDGGFGDDIGSYLVTSTTSGDAFKALVAKSAQLGMASRRIKPQEARDLKAAGAGNMVSTQQEHIVAVDSLVVITHPSNKVSQVSVEQLRGIYSGKITNWSELGGDDLPIKVINRQQSSGTSGVFNKAIFGDQAADLENFGTIADDNNNMAAMVNADAAAIGFVGYAFQRGAKAMGLVNECGITTTPDAFSAKTEEYPLQRRLYMYNRSDNVDDATLDFIKYATSEAADGVIAKSGFIDLGINSREMEMDGERAKALLDPDVDPFEGGVMREMLGQMLDYDRLSTTFRFRTGSSKMDERGKVDMARLVKFLEKAPEGSKVMLVGFTDDVGAFESNRRLSIDRAGVAASVLKEFAGDRIGHVEMVSTGYGEIAPAACNISDSGRAINRRVEVWLQLPDQG